MRGPNKKAKGPEKTAFLLYFNGTMQRRLQKVENLGILGGFPEGVSGQPEWMPFRLFGLSS